MAAKTVKALTFDTEKDGWEKSRGFVMREVPMPVLDEKKNPEDALAVILKVRYAGVCGSDRGLWYRNAFKEMVHTSLKKEGKTMRITGHEFLGEIVEVGSMVNRLYNDPDEKNRAKIEVGNLVSGDSHVTCGRCYQCRIGEGHVCLYEAILGISIDGIFAEYVKIPAKNLWAIDESRVRPEVAAIYDPFGNAVHASTVTDFRGQRVAILGCGPIGMFAILLARNFGAVKIIAADVNPANLKMAKELGAHETILITKKQKRNEWEADPEVIDRIMELTYGKGVDISMEMAGPSSSLNNCIQSTRRGGHVIAFGIKDGDVTIPNFSRTVIVRGLTLHGIIGRRIFGTWQIAQRVLSDKTNGIQDAIWNIIMKKGKGTIYDLKSFTPESFEKAMNENPKIVFKIKG
ncbi:theronine dehydrogenase [Candidatus Kaiserbacteria bacterium CG10_big_fil_rev_8_21_14_0_10_51_14]|uniref:Theronine dehydrogenase n=1 Tax=Candidatus Kaiserbacteria bacterium CG10_big_fil_rev_8_21_14_0_10_51_14 TaxID=1974610 RepID=A0A2H0UB15_9BACT|nr:MAG: theronine dehydrogenase [Candidatus Kaiserbacteria bacterium CG10_big_fil_rev_8_21_14_0_10_51_14]